MWRLFLGLVTWISISVGLAGNVLVLSWALALCGDVD